jgi:hypothetical protein
MLINLLLLTIAFLFPLTSNYQLIKTTTDYEWFVEAYSSFPILHVFYNRHFKNSKQFADF